jgi:diaminobutyrate-2-oxoglutarate transaminase
MIAGLEFRKSTFAASVAKRAREERLLIETCGPREEVIKILAPLNIDLAVFAEGLARLGRALDAENGLGLAA